MTYVASFEVRVSNHGETIGNSFYASCYGFTKVYLQVILDSKTEFVKVIVGVCI
jgi:hypothetical protein